MKKRYKRYLRLNIVSLVFIAISAISMTLAWFAYTGLSSVTTEIGVKSWNIELKKNEEKVSNDIVISLAEIYPGMATISEVVNIKNLGDADALVNYSIVSARILDNENDNYIVNDNVSSLYVEDILSHNYPFHVNINLTKGYALAQGGESVFGISISWPLDSGDDEMDSLWGNNAYIFQNNEKSMKKDNIDYQIRPSIEIKLSVTAEQDLHTPLSSDYHYNLGDNILYDVINNRVCQTLGDNCINTRVLDINNLMGDTEITLLPDLSNSYGTSTYDNHNTVLTSIKSGWNASIKTRTLNVEDLLKIISTDIKSSFLVRSDISNSIIGSLSYNDRITSEISRTITSQGYYSFLNNSFPFLTTTMPCYWLDSNYDENLGFALTTIDENISKIYGEEKDTTCNVVPVIIIDKPQEVAY